MGSSPETLDLPRGGPLTSCEAGGPLGAVLGGPCPGRLAQPRVDLQGGGPRQKVKWGWRGEGGSKEGGDLEKQSDHLLKSNRVGWGVRGGAAVGRDGDPLQAAAGAGAPAERSLPSLPPGVQRSAAGASAEHGRPLARTAAASSAGRRVGGSAGHGRCQPRAPNRAELSQAEARRGGCRRPGCSGGSGEEKEEEEERRGPLCSAPGARRSSATSAASVLGRSASEFGARLQSRGGWLGGLEAPVPCLGAGVLREFPPRTPAKGVGVRTRIGVVVVVVRGLRGGPRQARAS